MSCIPVRLSYTVFLLKGEKVKKEEVVEHFSSIFEYAFSKITHCREY